MAAPRRPLDDLRRRVALTGGLDERVRQRHDVESATFDVGGVGGDEPLQEQVAELLMVAVEFAIGRDQGEWRRAGGCVTRRGEEAAQTWGHPLAGEVVGVGRRLRLERDRRRQPRVVERDDDRGPAAQLDAVRTAAVDRVGGLPRGKDRGLDALRGGDAERRKVDRGLRQPQAARPPSEPQLELAQAPANLGSPVRGGRERQDRVVEGLGDRVAATGRHGEPRERRRVLGREPRAECRPEVPRDPGQVRTGRVWPVALRVDAGVPVVERRGGRLLRDAASPRVDPRRLVEVGVDREPAAGHLGAAAMAWSATAVARCTTRIVADAPGASSTWRWSRMHEPW